MIQAEDGMGHAQHCHYTTEWRDRFKDGASKWHTVETCDGHRASLHTIQRVAGSPPVRSELSGALNPPTLRSGNRSAFAEM